ncbi:MAG: glycosyltransferase family 4 protein [Betaproteobacteria bacterium]|nr:glycosyltransferase family 4 protein [Betaproteobacteria bacterium]
MLVPRTITVLQILPALNSGGVERGTLEISRHLVQQGIRSLVMSGGGRLTEQLQAEGGEHFTRPLGKKSLLTLRHVRPLRRFMLEQKVDILHVRSRLPAWIAYLAWRGMNPKFRPRLVTSVHGFYTVNRYSGVMTFGERVIAVSNTIGDYLDTNYPQLDKQRVRVIHRGVDQHEFPRGFQPDERWLAKWRQQHPHLQNAQLLTLPARLTRWKGQLDFIDLIARLAQSGLSVHGLIVGDADPKKQYYQRELEAHIAALNLQQHVSLVGHRNDLKEIMSISSMVLSLSRDPEAFGRTTPEALSLGVPVVGYDHGGAGEVLHAWYPQGATPVGDLDALTQKVSQLLAHPVPVPPQTDFTLEQMQADTLSVYRELLESTRTR